MDRFPLHPPLPFVRTTSPPFRQPLPFSQGKAVSAGSAVSDEDDLELPILLPSLQEPWVMGTGHWAQSSVPSSK